MKTRIIGDIHGDMDMYRYLIEGAERSYQVGDFGIGFVRNPIETYDTDRHKFIRGNHDSPGGCKLEPNWIKDGTVINDVMFIGGAYSIDWMYRTPGLSWWDDEELSRDELMRLVHEYTVIQPRVMITHEIPECIVPNLLWDCHMNDLELPSRTRDAFEIMFKAHQPELWIAGHWHVSWRREFNGTEFRVLNINEYIDIDL